MIMSKSVKKREFVELHVQELFRDCYNIFYWAKNGPITADDPPTGKYQYRKSSVTISCGDDGSIYLQGECRVRDGETVIKIYPVQFKVIMSE
jgi:hypothetical protein